MNCLDTIQAKLCSLVPLPLYDGTYDGHIWCRHVERIQQSNT